MFTARERQEKLNARRPAPPGRSATMAMLTIMGMLSFSATKPDMLGLRRIVGES